MNHLKQLIKEDYRFQQFDKEGNMIWLNRLQELHEYKKQYGHCDVPATHNQTLSNWVQEQRRDYIRRTSFMSNERIAMLNNIGFNWISSKDDPNNRSWCAKFEELKQYKAKHGHCNIKYNDENKPLTNWVQTQRSAYKKSKLSVERIERLNAIGFAWTAPPKSTWCDLKQMEKYPRVAPIRNEIDVKRMELEVAAESDIDTEQEDSQNNEQIKTCNSITPTSNDTKKKVVESDLAVGNDIDTQ